MSLEPVERAIETHSACSKRLSSPGRTEQLRNYRDGGGGGDDASSIDSKCVRILFSAEPSTSRIIWRVIVITPHTTTPPIFHV